MWLQSPAVCMSGCVTIKSRLEVSTPVKTREPCLLTRLFFLIFVFCFFFFTLFCFDSSVSALVALLQLISAWWFIMLGLFAFASPVLPFVPPKVSVKNGERCCFNIQIKNVHFPKEFKRPGHHTQAQTHAKPYDARAPFKAYRDHRLIKYSRSVMTGAERERMLLFWAQGLVMWGEAE